MTDVITCPYCKKRFPLVVVVKETEEEEELESEDTPPEVPLRKVDPRDTRPTGDIHG